MHTLCAAAAQPTSQPCSLAAPAICISIILKHRPHSQKVSHSHHTQMTDESMVQPVPQAFRASPSPYLGPQQLSPAFKTLLLCTALPAGQSERPALPQRMPTPSQAAAPSSSRMPRRASADNEGRLLPTPLRGGAPAADITQPATAATGLRYSRTLAEPLYPRHAARHPATIQHHHAVRYGLHNGGCVLSTLSPRASSRHHRRRSSTRAPHHRRPPGGRSRTAGPAAPGAVPVRAEVGEGDR